MQWPSVWLFFLLFNACFPKQSRPGSVVSLWGPNRRGAPFSKSASYTNIYVLLNLVFWRFALPKQLIYISTVSFCRSGSEVLCSPGLLLTSFCTSTSLKFVPLQITEIAVNFRKLHSVVFDRIIFFV